MTPDDIKRRAQAIRLPIKELATLAGCDEDNVHRVLRGSTDPRLSTMDKLTRALLAEEAKLRDQLAVQAGDAA